MKAVKTSMDHNPSISITLNINDLNIPTNQENEKIRHRLEKYLQFINLVKDYYPKY